MLLKQCIIQNSTKTQNRKMHIAIKSLHASPGLCGINSPHLFVDVILVPFRLFPTHLFPYLSLFPLLLHHPASSIITSLFTLGLKTTSLINHSPSHFFLWTAFTDYHPGRFFLSYSVSVFNFSMLFVFGAVR